MRTWALLPSFLPNEKIGNFKVLSIEWPMDMSWCIQPVLTSCPKLFCVRLENHKFRYEIREHNLPEPRNLLILNEESCYLSMIIGLYPRFEYTERNETDTMYYDPYTYNLRIGGRLTQELKITFINFLINNSRNDSCNNSRSIVLV